MRILYTIHALSGGGAERQLSYLSSNMIQPNIELMVVYRDKGPLGTKAFIKNVNYRKLKTKGNYNPAVLYELYNLINSFEPDIVQSWIIQFDILIGILKKTLKFKWVSREANAGSNHKGLKNKFLREILLSNVNKIVANSPQGYQYWYRRRPASMILNGFDQAPEEKGDSVSLLGQGNYILYVGRLVEHKRVDLLIKSFKNSSICSNYKLVICGTGNYQRELEKLIKKYDIEEEVKLLGFLPKEKIDALMKKATALCLLSDYEGMPNVVFEAMIHKTPVILSKTPSHRALFTADCVHYVNTSNEQNIVNCLNHVALGKADTLKKVKAMEFVSAHSIENMVKEYLLMYRELLELD